MSNISKRTRKNLKGVNPELIFLYYNLANIYNVGVINGGGVRSLKTQKSYVKRGVSRTLKSKHMLIDKYIFNRALDIIIFENGKPTWNPSNPNLYNEMIEDANEIIRIFNLNIYHPFNWDAPHFQMLPKGYV